MLNIRQDDAVTPIIGAILLLAILSTFLVMLQVVGLPVWNSGVEFDHSRDVRSDMQRLDAAVSEVASTNSHRSIVVDLGTRYPNRVILINPSPPSGRLSTENGFINISNTVSVEDNARSYWDGTGQSFPTRRITYEPNYNYYHDAPTRVYDNGVLYNSQEETNEAVLGDQSLINGDNINIVVLNGSVSSSSVQPTTVSLVPVSVSRTSVVVTNSTDEGITLTLNSRLSANDWEDLLGDERYVEDVSPGGEGEVEITLRGGIKYDLRMAEVGLEGGQETDPHYTVASSGNGTTVPAGGSAKISVDVRDKYNNPVGGENVDASIVSGDGSLTESTSTTASGGTATFEYNAPESATTVEIKTNVSGTTSPPLRTKFRVHVPEADEVADSTPPVIEDTDVESYSLEPCSVFSGNACDEYAETYQVRFEYNVSDDVGLEKAKLVLRHSPDSSSGGSLGNVTSTTHTLDGRQEFRGWMTPWLDRRLLDANRIDKYVVEIQVYDEGGNTDTALVEVPPPE